MPFIIYHFNQISSYSLIANLLCVPLSDFIIMPLGMIGLLLMPLELDHFPLLLMEYGINIMLAISTFISKLPYASNYLPSFSDLGIVLIVIAQVLWCLVKNKIRFIAIPMLAISILTLYHKELPDLIISGNQKLFAVKHDVSKLDKQTSLENEKLIFSSRQSERYSQQAWSQAYSKTSFAPKSLNNYNISNCNSHYCVFIKHNKKVVIVNDLAKQFTCFSANLFININGNDKCNLAEKNITANDIRENGTYIIKILANEEIVIDNVKNHLVKGKPWSKITSIN